MGTCWFHLGVWKPQRIAGLDVYEFKFRGGGEKKNAQWGAAKDIHRKKGALERKKERHR